MPEKRLTTGQCRRCSEINDADRLFCNGCGAKLFEPCLACEVEIGVWEQFCGKCGARSESEPGVELTTWIAREFLAGSKSAELVSSLDPANGRLIWQISGLTSMSDAAAESLSQFEGSELHLNGLTSLSDAAAESLIKCKGGISLDGLTNLSDAAAESLSKHGEWLSLNGLTSLSDVAAESLSKHEGELYLEGLTSLSDSPEHVALADKLSSDKGDLNLFDLTSLSDAAAESLSKYKGVLCLDGLTSLSDAAAESLSKHDGDLILGGLTSLSDAAAESLSKSAGWLELSGLTSLSDAAAESLSKKEGDLIVGHPDHHRGIHRDRRLGRHRGAKPGSWLALGGLTSLSDAAASWAGAVVLIIIVCVFFGVLSLL